MIVFSPQESALLDRIAIDMELDKLSPPLTQATSSTSTASPGA